MEPMTVGCPALVDTSIAYPLYLRFGKHLRREDDVILVRARE